MKMRRGIILAWSVASISFVEVFSASFVKNPSFESNYNDAFPHYGPIDEWTGGSGVNESAGPFHNAPTAIPDRTRVGFSQGSTTLSQEITGLTPGEQYWLQFHYDARNCCGGTIDITTKFADVELDRIPNVRPAMLSDKPYHFRNIPFVPTAADGTLAFTTTASGDATALFDGVTIVRGGTNRVVIANPSFEASGVLPAVGPVESIAGWTGAGIFGVDDSTGGQANNGAIPDQDLVGFIEGVGSLSQAISGLIAGRPYQVQLSYNAKSGTAAQIVVKAGDTVLFQEEVAAVGGQNAYRTKTNTFTAADISTVLSIEQTKEGAVLLIDDVRVIGETEKPLPPLGLSPAAAELAPGQKSAVTVTVPTELLAVRAANLTFRSSNTNVARLLGANEEGVLTLAFEKGATNVQTLEVEGAARGAARLELVESAGLTTANDFAVQVVSSFVRNPSFESSPAPGGVGYGSILAWNHPAGGVGLNRAAGPFHDNGVIPDREQVAFLQGPATVSQEISGLTAGANYWLQFYYNVRNCCGGTMNLAVRFAGSTLQEFAAITPVLEQNSYHFAQVPFTAASSSGLLEFVTTGTGDASLLLDGVNIVQRDAGQVVVRNPSFEASGSPPNVGYIQPNNIAGWEAGGAGRGVNINGAGPFTDNGLSSEQDRVLLLQGNGTFVSQVLTGLTANAQYTVVFEVNARSCCGPEPSVFRVSIDDAPVLEEEITPVGGSEPYTEKRVTFTAAGTEATLKLENVTPAGDHTVLYDNVRVLSGTPPAAGPRLLARRVADTLRLSWPVSAANFQLQSTAQLPGGWAAVTVAPTVEGNENVVLEAVGTGRRFYRLVGQ